MTIRNTLLAGVAVAALSLPGLAQAQIPVTDAGLMGQGWQQLMSWATELQNWTQQLTAMQQQLQTMLGTYNSITHAPNVASGLESALSALGIQNQLPVNPWAVQQLIAGQGGMQGIGSAIGGLVNRSWTANHVYTPTDGSYASQQLIARANGAAGTQGLAEQLYTSIAAHLPILSQLHDAILASPNVKDTADLQARYQTEQAYVQDQVAQFNAITQMYQVQQAVWQQQAVEKDAQNLQSFIDEAAAHGY